MSEAIRAYVAEGGEATLALMGLKLMKLPDEPYIRFAGLLSERERPHALEAALLELNLAQTKLEVLREYTKAIKIKELDTEVSKAEAKWKSSQSSQLLELSKLKAIEAQLEKCVIKAPKAGTVMQILVANAHPVEFGEPLMIVE